MVVMPPDNTKEIIMTDKFSAAVTINSEPAKVWAALTKHELMIQWMGEPEMKPEIHTNWKVNEGILIRGFHHLKFENKGIVISCDKEKKLSYSHLSSLSGFRINQRTIQSLNLF
jgi:uncharacterized protein YndB with AHSA1/START domain